MGGSLLDPIRSSDSAAYLLSVHDVLARAVDQLDVAWRHTNLCSAARAARRVCATFVRMTRERGIKACDATGEPLDEAAQFLGESPVGLTTEEVRAALDPVQFIQRHGNVGDPHPDETRRMIAARRERLADARRLYSARKEKLEQAAQRLKAEIAALLSS